MTKPELYRSVMKQLKEAGLRAYMMRPEQLVFQTGHSNSGKSAWLAICEDEWLIGTWAPRLYRIPSGTNLAKFCQAFVSDPSSMASVSDDIISAFRLEKLSDEETETYLEAVSEPTYLSITANLTKRGIEVDQLYRNALGVFGHENWDKQGHHRRISVTEFEGSWHIMTMGPYAYRVPVEESIEDVCIACLTSPDFDMFTIPEDLVVRYWLVRLSHEEWEKIEAAIEETPD